MRLQNFGDDEIFQRRRRIVDVFDLKADFGQSVDDGREVGVVSRCCLSQLKVNFMGSPIAGAYGRASGAHGVAGIETEGGDFQPLSMFRKSCPTFSMRTCSNMMNWRDFLSIRRCRLIGKRDAMFRIGSK